MRTIMPWRPLHHAFATPRTIDQMFETALGKTNNGFATSLDLRENDDQIVVRVEVPGVESDDIDINVNGQVLTISGEKKDGTAGDQEGYRYSERRFGSFKREVRLSSTVDVEAVSAEHLNGVLTITLPRAQEAKPRRIPVSAPKDSNF